MSSLKSISELSDLTGKDRRTITKRLKSLTAKTEGTAHLYDSAAALEAIYLYGMRGDESGEVISKEEADRRLSVKRGEEIDLDMEIKRKTRIPLEDIESLNDQVFSNAAGLLKAHEGKTLDHALLSDLFAEFRRLGEALKI